MPQINVSAANISALDGTLTAGYVFDYIDNSSGGSIGGNASVNFNLTGDLTTQGAGFPPSSPFSTEAGRLPGVPLSRHPVNIYRGRQLGY